MNFDTAPTLRVISRDHPTIAGASHFVVTGDLGAVVRQVSVIVNDELVQSATFETLPRKTVHAPTGAVIWRSEGVVKLWPEKSTRDAPAKP